MQLTDVQDQAIPARIALIVGATIMTGSLLVMDVQDF
jgi:hypothetical protein